MKWADVNPYYEGWRLGYGVGPMLGSNFHIGSATSLCLDVGLRSNFYFGKWIISYEEVWGENIENHQKVLFHK